MPSGASDNQLSCGNRGLSLASPAPRPAQFTPTQQRFTSTERYPPFCVGHRDEDIRQASRPLVPPARGNAIHAAKHIACFPALGPAPEIFMFLRWTHEWPPGIIQCRSQAAISAAPLSSREPSSQKRWVSVVATGTYPRNRVYSTSETSVSIAPKKPEQHRLKRRRGQSDIIHTSTTRAALG